MEIQNDTKSYTWIYSDKITENVRLEMFNIIKSVHVKTSESYLSDDEKELYENHLDARFIIYKENEKIIGFAITQERSSYVIVLKLTVDINPQYENIGKKIFTNIQIEYPNKILFCYVESKNKIAREYYKKLGAVENRYNFYENDNKIYDKDWIALSFGELSNTKYTLSESYII